MASENSFFLNQSIMYRNIQKYFDKMLAPYEIGSGQYIFLCLVNENEGITMQELSSVAEVDKGTTTKTVQRLIDQGYLRACVDENDRRVKRLYSTEKSSEIMRFMYDLRKDCRNQLAKNVDFNVFEKMLQQVADNSRTYSCEEPDEKLRIGGLVKMTLLDVPGAVAATVFLSGCPFKCPFCQNRDLVFVPEDLQYLKEEDVRAYLSKRKGLLDAVCISGGEPLLQEGLPSFLKQIKDMGYLVKLDTNGYFPDRLKAVLEQGLVDRVAMDIKNSRERYAQTTGLNADVFKLDLVERSIDLLMQSDVDYEFRTTVVRELHDEESLMKIAKRIKGCKAWVLQQYKDGPTVLMPGLSAYSEAEMKKLLECVQQVVPQARLRGVKEEGQYVSGSQA